MNTGKRDGFTIEGITFQGDDTLEGLVENGVTLTSERINEMLSQNDNFDGMVQSLITLGTSIDGAPALSASSPKEAFEKSPSPFHQEVAMLIALYEDLNRDTDLDRQRDLLEEIGKQFPYTAYGNFRYTKPIERLLRLKAEKLHAPWPDGETIDVSLPEERVPARTETLFTKESMRTSVENASTIDSLAVILETWQSSTTITESDSALVTLALNELKPLIGLPRDKAREMLYAKISSIGIKPETFFASRFPEPVGTKLNELLQTEVDLELA